MHLRNEIQIVSDSRKEIAHDNYTVTLGVRYFLYPE